MLERVANGDHAYPSPASLQRDLLDASTCPWRVVHFLLAEPLDPTKPNHPGLCWVAEQHFGVEDWGEEPRRGAPAELPPGQVSEDGSVQHLDGGQRLTSSDQLFLYRAANGAVYLGLVLALWATPFDFRCAADEEIKLQRGAVHVVESALATAFGVHKVQGSRTVVFDAPRGINFQPCNIADPLSVHLTAGSVQYEVTR